MKVKEQGETALFFRTWFNKTLVIEKQPLAQANEPTAVFYRFLTFVD
jgi:hypothetical protein